MINPADPIDKQFAQLLSILTSSKFIASEGLGNEVPIFIYPYLPEREFEFQLVIPLLKIQLEQKGVRVLDINLYDLCVDLLKEAGIFDELLNMESDLPKRDLEENLIGPLGAQDHVVPFIYQRMQSGNFDVVLLWGAGQVYPYLRAHAILNNMQVAVTDRPVVLFYPGTYQQDISGFAELSLFNRLPSYRYYRAFNLLKYDL